MRISGYSILSVVARDPVITTYKALQEAMDREVLIKVVSAPDPGLRERIMADARAAAAMSHHGVTIIQDIGQTEDGVYICHKAGAGSNLMAVLKKSGALDEHGVRSLAREAARILARSHSEGVVHGFLWPGCIRMTAEGGVTISDFGTSAAYIAHDSEVLRAYSSPEAGTPQGDVYSLGAMLYHCVTGAPPEEPINPPRGPLGEAIARMLAPAGERYRNMAEVEADLDRLERPRAPSPSSPSRKRVSAEGLRRYRGGLRAAALVVAVLVAAAVVRVSVPWDELLAPPAAPESRAASPAGLAPELALSTPIISEPDEPGVIGEPADGPAAEGEPEELFFEEHYARPLELDYDIDELEQELEELEEEHAAAEAEAEDELLKLLEPCEEVAAAVKEMIRARAELGKGTEIFYPMGASAARGRILAANDYGITVQDRGQELALPWALWDARRRAGVALRLAATGEERYTAALYLAQNKFIEEAQRELDAAVRQDASVADKVDLLRQAFARKAADEARAAAEAIAARSRERESESPTQQRIVAAPGVQLGLAAHFPYDVGISSHPDVIFASGFERGFTGWTIPSYGGQRDRCTIVQEPEPVHSGRSSLRIVVTIENRDATADVIHNFSRGEDLVFTRFYVRFPHDTGMPHHFVGIRAQGPKYVWRGGAGQLPSGDGHFSTTMEPSTSGTWHLYTYWHEMRSWQTVGGRPDGRPTPYYGNNFRVPGQIPFERDTWICVEVMLKANTVGQSDGEQAFWIDGRLIGWWKPGSPDGRWIRENFRIGRGGEPFEGFNWRTDPEVKINRLRLQWYFSRDHAERHGVLGKPNTVYFDDVVISRSYIGPMLKPPVRR